MVSGCRVDTASLSGVCVEYQRFGLTGESYVYQSWKTIAGLMLSRVCDFQKGGFEGSLGMMVWF